MASTTLGLGIVLALDVTVRPVLCKQASAGAIQSDALTPADFGIRLGAITVACLRVPSEFAKVMAIDPKRPADFWGCLKNCQHRLIC